MIDNGLVQKWQKTKTELATLQKKERELRAEITAELLEKKLEGTSSFKTDEFKLTATAVLNRSIDQAVLESIWDDLTFEEQQCIEYKPKLVMGKYKGYEAEGSRLMEAITVKPGMAQLKMEVL